MIVAFIITTLLSAMVSAAELLSKFKDEPFAIITRNGTAWLYMLFNVVIACLSLIVILYTDLFPNGGVDLLKAAACAGLGSTIIMRSKFFKININGKEAAIGPEIIINTFLETMEKRIDRDRALQRKVLVEQYMGEVNFSEKKGYVETTLIASLQTNSPEFTKTIMDEIEKINNSDIEDRQKSYALGYLILDVIGEKFLRSLFKKEKKNSKDMTIGK